jgi:site-specific DNA recombinase
MIAAIYARKSTDQFGVAEEHRSVSRQMEMARTYASTKGWQILEDSVFVDDGISGAEFANRPGFLRLMNSLKPRPRFNVLVMSEESRLGRESIETAYALKQMITAGVRVFFYMEDRERTLDTPTDKLMMSVTAFADELEREKARQRTYDAMARKAKAGHVTGGRVFGFDNAEVLGEPDAQGRAQRLRVERRINESHADVIRRIFALCAEGRGYSGIAKLLNAEGAVCPRPQQDRPAGWSPSTVYEILHRRLYLGEIVWNQTRKRDRWGQHRQSSRPESDWLKIPAPELRIVSDETWSAAHARLPGARVAVSGAQPMARQRDRESKYLLSGFARCGECGGSFAATSRAHGTGHNRHRVHFYSCLAHHKRGPAICGNGLHLRMEAGDTAVLGAIAEDVLRPEIVEAVVGGVFDALRDSADVDTHAAELVTLAREIARLTEAIATGGDMQSLVAALRARQQRRDELIRSMRPAMPSSTADRRTICTAVRQRLTDWRALLTRNVQDGRSLLRQVLSGPLRFTPENGSYRLEGQASFGALLTGIGLPPPTMLASPTGFEPVF